MKTTGNTIAAGFWGITIALLIAGATRAIYFTPVEQTMGPIQKIFYLHLPVAICTFIACLTSFAASVGYLSQKCRRCDDLADASAKVAVGLCTIVLATGMIWGKSAWGSWWTWSPRLTFSLVLWLLYVVYLMIRASIESSNRRGTVAAVYGVIAFLDVPLVFLSVRLMPDIHPNNIQLEPSMKLTLAICMVPVVLASIGLIRVAYLINARRNVEQGQGFEPIQRPSMLIAGNGGES